MVAMRKISVLGRTIPIWAIVLLAAATVGTIAGLFLIGNVEMPWQVSPPPVTMSPKTVTLDIGTVYYGDTVVSNPKKVAELHVNDVSDIVFMLSGDLGGFDEVEVEIELVKHGNNGARYSAVIKPHIVVSDVMHPSPIGWGGWSDKEASRSGIIAACFVRGGDVAKLVKWVPGASVDGVSYPNTPFGYVYDESIPETGCIFQNDGDSGESIRLVLVYPPVKAVFENVEPGTYDVKVGYKVTAGASESFGKLVLDIFYKSKVRVRE